MKNFTLHKLQVATNNWRIVQVSLNYWIEKQFAFFIYSMIEILHAFSFHHVTAYFKVELFLNFGSYVVSPLYSSYYLWKQDVVKCQNLLHVKKFNLCCIAICLKFATITDYHIAQNFDSGKVWWIWQMGVESS